MMRISKIFTLSSILLGRATSFTPKFTPVITTIARNNISSTSVSKLLASLEGQDAIDSKGSAVSFTVTYVSQIRENVILFIKEINLTLPLILLFYYFSYEIYYSAKTEMEGGKNETQPWNVSVKFSPSLKLYPIASMNIQSR